MHVKTRFILTVCIWRYSERELIQEACVAGNSRCLGLLSQANGTDHETFSKSALHVT